MKPRLNHNLKVSVISLIISCFLASCGGGSHHKGGGDAPEDAFLIENGDLMSGKPYVVKIKGAENIDSDKGSVSKINPVTGEEGDEDVWFFTMPSDYYASYTATYEELKNLNVVFSVTDKDGNVTDYERIIPVEDSYLMDQWHLYNIGQNPFGVDVDPLPGIDLNVIPAWRNVVDTDGKKSLTDGSGVKIAVIDTPVDLQNEDLKDKIYRPADADERFMNLPFNRKWLKNYSKFSHGTEVAGIIGASGINGVGVRGVAYNAEITSFIFFNADTDDFDDDDDDSFLYLPDVLKYIINHPEYRVINASFGNTVFERKPDQTDLLNSLLKNRTSLIHAMGNSFETDDVEEFLEDLEMPTRFSKKLLNCDTYSTDCLFTLSDEIARHPYTINVAAMTASGKKSTYSSTSVGLWISGFGGEYGYEDEALKDEGEQTEAAIVTTFTGRDNIPYSQDEDTDTPWRTAGPENKKYYTAGMNGTSAATPTISGVVALLYQVKPDISVGQIRYILARTGRNDSTLNSMTYGPVEAEDHIGQKIVTDPGWIENASGLRFANYFGFGLADAGAAVKMASECDNDDACRQLSDFPDHYASTNTNPCIKQSDNKIECTLKDFYQIDEFGNRAGELSGTAIIDALTVDMKSLLYTVAQTEKSCSGLEKLPEHDSDDEKYAMKYKKLMLLANNNLQINISSPAGTKGVMKSLYSNWDINFDVDDSMYESEPDRTAEIPVSFMYREELTEDSAVKLTITSKCEINIDALNEGIHADVFTYPKL